MQELLKTDDQPWNRTRNGKFLRKRKLVCIEALEHLSDEALIDRARSGKPSANEAAIDELFRRYLPKVALWCFRVTGDREQAADLAQEIMLRAHRSLATFRGGSKFSTWMYSITRNHCFNHLKAQASNRHVEALDENLSSAVDQAPTILESLQQERTMQEFRSLIADSLDATEQRVMLLHYGEELPLAEVTKFLGLTNASGAKAYIVSARRKLNAAVERWRARSRSPRGSDR